MSNTIPAGWSIKRLGDLVDIRSSNVDKKSYELDQPVQLCNYTDVYYNNRITRGLSFMAATAKGREIERFTLEKDDVIITKDSETPDDIAVPAYVPDDLPGVICGYHLALLKPFKDRSSGHFLSHLLQLSSVQHYFYILANGTTRFGLTADAINGAPLATPPLPEQQKIATILSSVDDVIEKTRAQIDKLKDLKTGLMQELLTKGIGHTEFKDSPVGRIPAMWKIAMLDEVFLLRSGSTPSRAVPEYFSSSNLAHPWVKTLDLNDGDIKVTDEKITDEAIANSSCKIFPVGTALVAMYGGWKQIGRSGVIKIPAATNQAICALIPHGFVSGDFANNWLIAMRHRWKAIAASSRKDPNITKQDVSEFLIAIPPLPEQKMIVERLHGTTSLIDTKIKRLSHYENLKRALMQDLLTGKVRVNVTDKEVAVA